MSTRSFDHCDCGHTRMKHENFDGGCKKCGCNTFQRKIRVKTLPIK